MKTTLKLKNLIKDLKLYWVNPNITEDNFPPEEISTGDYKVYHFNRYISSEDAIGEMKIEGYRPANAYELLSWAKENWKDKEWVVALGSSAQIDSDRRVVGLYRGDSERYLNLRWFDDGWDAGFRFLACKNSDPDSLELRVAKLEAIIKHHNLGE